MNKKSLWKLILILAIPCIIGFMPAPAGLSELAWVLFGIYLAAIVGLVIKPFPEPVVLLIAVAASMVVVGNLSDGAFKTTAVLSGYSSGTTWLVFSAFTLSAAFVTTGLGKRIAYLLIGKIGNTTLGLGYVTVFLDLVLAPATPSNTARAGGIVLPIINSVAVAMVTVTLLSSLLFSSALSCVISSLPVVPISLLCYRYLPCWRTSPAHR